MSDTNNENVWLCRNCNTLISSEAKTCPLCSAERPEQDESTPLPEEIEEVVKRDIYTNETLQPKSKYNFREAVLVNSADIILILGVFCTLGTLIAPRIISFDVDAPMLWAICVAVGIFATTLISWAILRTLAEISRMLRNGNK